jgi:hypothetical protein
MCPEYFFNKPKRFGVFQNFLNKIGTFPFNLKTLKQNQNVLLGSRGSRVFKTVFSYRFSHNLYWPFLGLCYILTASTDILRDLFKPLTASKTSQGFYRHSHGPY